MTDTFTRDRLDGERHRQAMARRTDPITSQEAARRERDLRASQREVLQLFRRFGAMDDRALLDVARHEGSRQSDSGLRTRRAELVKQGLVYDTGRKVDTTGGGHAIVWATVPLDDANGQGRLL